jgi:carbamoyltransferase
MGTILGITDGDDAGAVLLVDGRLEAAVNEERLNRMKMSIGFPRLAVQEVLKLTGKKPGDIDRVAMAAEAETFNPESRPNKGWFQDSSPVASIRNEISSALAKPLGVFGFARKSYKYIKRMTMGRRRSGVRRILAEMGIHAPISYHNHHRCHAFGAFCASGYDDALSVSLDGGGDGCSSHVYVMDRNGENLLNVVDSFDSLGNYYAYVTHLCGFRASIHEGKITGLSASGEPHYLDLFRNLVDFSDGQIRNKGKLFYKRAINTLSNMLPQDWEHKDLAASVQKHLEEVAVSYVRYWMQQAGKRRVCLSGGVFANVILNQRIADLPDCDRVFVFPAMGDGGIAAGAAYSEWRKSGKHSKTSDDNTRIAHAYLGPSYSDGEIEKSIIKAGLPYKRIDDIEEVIARLVHRGKVVARFNGAMEYGPRALGNRTILYKTDDPKVNTWLNKRLNRTEFMPFAPACLSGHEEKLFNWNPASRDSARYMTITLDCTEWMKNHCPAVVHVDGTARPQIVDYETNPSFYKILTKYYELSGVPVLVNTSFNMHEEPIVCTPDDAIRAYQLGRLDNLAMGPYLLGDEPHSISDYE